MEQIAKLEKEMNQVHTQFKDAEQHYGSDLLNLVVAKGFITKLLANESVKHFIERNECEILEHFELVVNTVSMEEAVQQQQTNDLEFEPELEQFSGIRSTAPEARCNGISDNFSILEGQK